MKETQTKSLDKKDKYRVTGVNMTIYFCTKHFWGLLYFQTTSTYMTYKLPTLEIKVKTS